MNESIKEQNPSGQDAPTIRLNNQALMVDVNLSTGRFRVRDLVTGVYWRMDPYIPECGRLVFSMQDETLPHKTYLLGKKGKRGVQFRHKSSFVRSGIEDDYSSLTLEGPLGDDKETLVEIEFLLSEAFPTLDFCLRVLGDGKNRLEQIAFPTGFAVTTEESGSMIVPQSSEQFLKENTAEIVESFQSMHPERGRKRHEFSFFAATKRSRTGRESGCLGFLSCFHAELDVRSDETLSVATPGIRNAREDLNNGNLDYRFQYRFIPDVTDEAIAWLYREHIREAIG